MTLNLPTIDAAGGLTLDPKNRILFIFKDGKWDLPKGLVEKSESPSKTALKEVSEETGLNEAKLRVMTELIQTVHVSKFAKTKYLKKTRWFLLRYSGSSEDFKPQRSEGIEHCAWIPSWELDTTLSNAHVRIQYLINFWLKVKKELDL